MGTNEVRLVPAELQEKILEKIKYYRSTVDPTVETRKLGWKRDV